MRLIFVIAFCYRIIWCVCIATKIKEKKPRSEKKTMGFLIDKDYLNKLPIESRSVQRYSIEDQSNLVETDDFLLDWKGDYVRIANSLNDKELILAMKYVRAVRMWTSVILLEFYNRYEESESESETKLEKVKSIRLYFTCPEQQQRFENSYDLYKRTLPITDRPAEYIAIIRNGRTTFKRRLQC